ncbi:HlyD family secretion protein [Pantanalinema sp. GBBB05]|uniref:HlyD family secretion protein n=1 Tax=Pantanalinema sp. GBBB05 TaxID=2604139 RepID=UPI001D48DA88|nr:HlyD family efflux transporter periplasmic adaptor subunit [Pantanalinema sp. GBBB05]
MTPSTSAKSSSRLTLKVVSPSAPPLPAATSSSPPIKATSVAPPTPYTARRRLIFSAVIAGMIGASLFPITYEVGGTVILEAKPGNRRAVTTTIPGTIETLAPAIQPGTMVKQGQVIATLRSRELEREIAQVQQEIAEAKQQIENQQRQQIRAEAAVKAAIATRQALEQQVVLAEQVAQENVPSQIQEIQTTIATKQTLLASAERELRRYDELLHDGAISQAARDKVQRDRDMIAGEVETAQQTLASTQQKLRNQAQDIQIQASRQTVLVAAEQQTAESEWQMQAISDRLAQLHHRLTKLQQDQQQLVLRAPISGVVITPDFALKLGRELKTDQGLLEIVKLDELTGYVEIDEQDINYIQNGKPVRFRLSHDKLKSFDARVERTIPNVQSDQTKQRRTVAVLIHVNNPDGQLQNGSSGYARVYSETIPLYQRVGREILRLFSFERL